ncbi:hypothetical protein ACHAQI_001703 [Fusarium lateritium]
MPRSRNGCTTCKRRHRKCDETKPACLECQKNKLQCDGYAIKLQWDVGVASRGKLTGAALPVLVEGGKKRRAEEITIDGSAGAFGQFQSAQLSEGQGEMLDTDSPLDMESCVHDAEPQWFQKRSDREKELFKQFFQRTVFSFYSTSTDDSFCAELERLALQNEPLYLSLIATCLYNSNPRNPSPLFHDLCD